MRVPSNDNKPAPYAWPYCTNRFIIRSYAQFLSQPFVAEGFAFRGTVLSGAKVDRPLQAFNVKPGDKMYRRSTRCGGRRAAAELCATARCGVIDSFLPCRCDDWHAFQLCALETDRNSTLRRRGIAALARQPPRSPLYSPLTMFYPKATPVL
jgi:hypothetical protein